MEIRTIGNKSQYIRYSVLVGIVAVAVAFSLANRKGKVFSYEEINQTIASKPSGSFKAYSKKELAKQKLGIEDFSSNAADARQFAADPRIEQGHKEHVVSHDYLPDGTLLESDYKVHVLAASPARVKIEKSGVVRLHREEWIEFKEVTECVAQTRQLSSGVWQRNLVCDLVSSTDPLKQLEVDYPNCRVEPLSARSRKSQAEFGKFRTKNGQNFVRATRETVSMDGDIICGSERQGLGRETQVFIYTNEQPSAQDPAVGSRKQLFSLRTIVKSDGSLVLKTRDEIMGSDTGFEELSRPVAKLSSSRGHRAEAKKSFKKQGKAKSKSSKKVAKR